MIKILDPSTASKIAAGEVVESPKSVLKELIENSLDAEASSILIYIEKAGKKLIKVIDNGKGMSKDELELSIYRYATSKINSIDDLTKLKTFGFRGEALFSIFSVSKISISSYKDGETGYKLEGEGGDFKTIRVFPSPPLKGTIVEVKNLFFNTPARFKFLKSDQTLKSSIIKLFEEFALINPQIKFTLTIDNNEIYNLSPDKDIISRAEKILGNEIIKDTIYFEEDFNDIKIKGFFSTSNFLSSKNFQYTYVNSRIIESKIINSAIYRAIENIRENKHPVFLISVEIDPSKIDVNIHPQKKEVKFEDENFIYMAIVKIITKIIENKQNPVKIYDNIMDTKKPLLSVNEEKEKIIIEELHQKFSQDELISFKKETDKTWYNSPITFIGQVFSKILIFQTSTSIILVDQHAAAERITFEKYINEFENKNIKIQKLITPYEIKMPKSSVEKIMEFRDWLKESGFEINQNGPSSIAVYSYPSAFNLTNPDIYEIFIYILENLPLNKNIPLEVKRNLLATIACKKSIKFNERIEKEKAMALIEELNKTSDSLHCPHGRPTIIEITLDEILKRFGRN